MGTRTQHTKTDLSRLCCAVVVGCATRATRSWLEARRPASCASPVRWQQPSPCQRTGPSSSSSEFFCSRVPVFESFFCCCGVKQRSVLGTVAPRVLPAARAAAATPRRVTSKVQSSVSCFSPKAKSRGDYRDRFFFVDFERIRFSAGLSRDASLGGARFFVFFFFFVLLSEDNHRRSPHVAVGVTRR